MKSPAYLDYSEALADASLGLSDSGSPGERDEFDNSSRALVAADRDGCIRHIQVLAVPEAAV
jgi:hypothetical protein